jgi:hypothetical protein
LIILTRGWEELESGIANANLTPIFIKFDLIKWGSIELGRFKNE